MVGEEKTLIKIAEHHTTHRTTPHFSYRGVNMKAYLYRQKRCGAVCAV